MIERINKYSWVRKGLALFKQGLSPRALALSITLGVVIGILPLFGIATWIVTFLAVSLRVNLPITIFTLYAVSPLHLILFLPFIKLGEWLLSIDATIISLDAIHLAFKTDFFKALYDLSFELAYGVLAWAILAIPIAAIVYFMLWTIFSYYEGIKKRKVL